MPEATAIPLPSVDRVGALPHPPGPLLRSAEKGEQEVPSLYYGEGI